MRKIFYLSIFMLLFITVACEITLENEDISLPETNLIGNWTVNAYLDNNIIFGPFIISTQTTPETETIYIKDNGEFWNFQTKAEIVNQNDAFETESSLNEISSIEAKIKIINGNVINNDSIAFDIQFEDDETPYGFTYKIKGHRKF